MKIRKLEEVDAFVAIDLEGVPGHGLVRLAPRILQNGARDLARSMTYGLASLGRKETGVSAGINVDHEGRETAIASFVAEIARWGTGFSLVAGKGLNDLELGNPPDPNRDQLLVAGAVAAGLAVLPKASTAVVDDSSLAGPLKAELSAIGIEVLSNEAPFVAEADLLFSGSRVGAIDHDTADRLAVKAVVPVGPLPITTRAVAHCQRRGILALPDFITTLGPLIGDIAHTRTLVAEIITEVSSHDLGPLLGACIRAEDFLSSWQNDLPFGRPMAP